MMNDLKRQPEPIDLDELPGAPICEVCNESAAICRAEDLGLYGARFHDAIVCLGCAVQELLNKRDRIGRELAKVATFEVSKPRPGSCNDCSKLYSKIERIQAILVEEDLVDVEEVTTAATRSRGGRR